MSAEAVDWYAYSVAEIRRLRVGGDTTAMAVAAFTRRLTYRQLCKVLRGAGLAWVAWCRSLGTEGEPDNLYVSEKEALAEDHIRQAGMVVLGITDPTQPCNRRVVVERRWPRRQLAIVYSDPLGYDKLEYVLQNLPYRVVARRIIRLRRSMPPPEER